jgi:DNA-binding HxlR family transcriptional regulator
MASSAARTGLSTTKNAVSFAAMQKGYGQYCPIAKGAEIFAERWTPLIIRNVHVGAHTFSEIAAGCPRISSTLLT